MPVLFEKLTSSDLRVDEMYVGGRNGNSSDDPLPRLLKVDNQGGFRIRGKRRGDLELVALISTFDDPDWPDELDRETGIFTYFGDNKKPGRELHDTGRGGNLLLSRMFENASSGRAGREKVPPVFLFSRADSWRDVIFLGLAVPGASDLTLNDDLVGIWRTAAGQRFQNYRARFSVLDASVIHREWITSIIERRPTTHLAPQAWQVWVQTGQRRPLTATRSLEHRTKNEQLPQDEGGWEILRAIQEHFQGDPHAFEHFASAVARLAAPDIATLDVTRPSRDGGRDGVGQFRIGRGPGSILVDFALEAKCYRSTNAVGVKEMSRLISRLRHRQFGVIVTTSFVDSQAYREIKEDKHPIMVIAAGDIVALLRSSGRSSRTAVSNWLAKEFPVSRPEGT